MKRYIFGIMAIVIATTAVAFINPAISSQPLGTFTFYYVPPTSNDYTQASVETEGNWKTAPGTIPDCSLTANKACSIVVSDTYTTGTGSSRVLDFDLHAKAGAGGGSNGYVPDRTATMEIASSIEKP